MNIVERLKMLRIVRLLLNLKYLKRLKANAPLYKEFGINRKVWQSLSHEKLNQQANSHGPWLDENYSEQKVREHPDFHQFSFYLQEKILQWNRDGYLTITRFCASQKVDALNQSLEENLTPEETKLYQSNRLMNIYRQNPEVNALFRDPDLLKLLSFLLGKDIHPFQTINFYRSSSQKAHSDAVHLTTEPLGYSLGVWVALEDVQPGSGEFFFYPGSHKLPYILNPDFGRHELTLPTPDALHKKYESKVDDVLSAHPHLKQQIFPAKKGDILIWHTNLLHGSLPKQNLSLTRKSLIMHYFAKGVLCYHEMLEKPAVLG